MSVITLILSDRLIVLLIALGLNLLLSAMLPLRQLELFAAQRLEKMERKLNRPERGAVTLRMRGLLIFAAMAVGLIVSVMLLKAFSLLVIKGVWFDILVVALIVPLFPLLQRLFHIQQLLNEGNAREACDALSPLVQQDLDPKDMHMLSRAAIEQSVIDVGEKIASPLFWYLLLGLPGLLLACLVALLEPHMAGPGRNHFGWAVERAAAVLHFFPARMAAALILLASAFIPSGHAWQAFQVMARDGHRLLVPNAGWPVASTAGALGLALGGPRQSEGIAQNLPWAGKHQRAMATPRDVLRSLILIVTALLLLWLALAAAAWGLYLS